MRHKGLHLLDDRYVQLSSEGTANVSFYGGTCPIMSLLAATCVYVFVCKCVCVTVWGYFLYMIHKFIFFFFFFFTSWLITCDHLSSQHYRFSYLVWCGWLWLKCFLNSVTYLTFKPSDLKMFRMFDLQLWPLGMCRCLFVSVANMEAFFPCVKWWS